jgi:maltooligosyltrehalose trehalohydrolase
MLPLNRGPVVGAEATSDGVRFRVWAPRARELQVVFDDEKLPPLRLAPETDGYFCGMLSGAGPGLLYRYRLDGDGPYPDPRSRYQPRGPHGPSMVVDAQAHRWRDREWRGPRMHGQVLYEMHIGAFTPEGTFDSAARRLPYLADLGVTCLEILPIGEFPGRFNWGYDAVDLYAPYHGYGDYDAFKRFVDAAHALKLNVILDVVYNHLGGDGNYLACFSKDYFTDRYRNEWGDAINFDGPSSGPVRDFFIANAVYWVSEFHLDGLRLDATQSLHDASTPHIIAEIVQRVRAAAQPRSVILIGENEPQRVELLEPIEQGGFGIDALWNDDFHHSARVALTGRPDGYFHDHRGRAQEFVSAVKYGFLFQGQYYGWQKKPRGTPALDQPALSFVTYIQNHDQVANTFYGLRLQSLTSPGRYRAMSALLLLAPQTPLIFMGQELSNAGPFAFFADHAGELAAQVREGRRKFMRQFEQYATPEAQERLLDPSDTKTFERSKLDPPDPGFEDPLLDLYRDLLRLRRDDPVISQQERVNLDGGVLAERAFLIRWFDAQHGDRLLLVNLGDEIELRPAPEPLLAPPRNASWEFAWSSDDPRYAGPGAIDPSTADYWRVPAESATLLRARQFASASAGERSTR